MPTRSRNARTGTAVQELGLPGRAVAALARAGITTVDELAALTRRELSAVPGLGPAMVTAIRAVVPEPVAQGLWPLPDEDDGPASPAIPSFESLRGPRRRSALDLLVPEQPREAATPEQGTAGETDEEDADDGVPRFAKAPRPAEWADLAAFGVRGVRAAAALHWRVTVWWVRAPARLVERLRAGS